MSYSLCSQPYVVLPLFIQQQSRLQALLATDYQKDRLPR